MDLAKLFLFQLLLAAVVCVLVAHASSSSDSDYYKLLGVSRDASDKDIKRAFRKLAVKYHPDKNPDPEARKRFEKIANAYDVLSDAEKRRHYDTFGTDGPEASQHGSPFDYDSFFNTGGGTGGSFHFTFDNIFKDFFGEDDDAGFFQHFHHSHGNHHPDAHNLHNFFSFDTEQDSDDSLFSNSFGGGFGGGFGNFHSFHSESHSQGQAHRSCRTVTKKVGNTVTTYTTCS